MSAVNIDQLNIELTADSKKASSAIEELAKTLEGLKSALAPIANVNLKVSNSFNTVTKNTQKAANATKDYADKTKKAGKSAQSFAQKMAQSISTTRTIVSVFQNAANTMADWFNESNEYIETVNLFNVTMGEGAEKAREFAESVSMATGIDPKEWMQYQGIFKNLTAGFGIASDKANIMSQNLTQLSYDMASFFNAKTVQESFDKLSSAMSGQVKGLREYGIDTTVASLQQYALSKGIDASVRSMSQAEKSLLRYNYIMEKSIIMQGDMARTIITPANSLRILNAQLTQMKRALGNIVSVLVVQFIPYVQAMVQIITEAANAIALFFGFDASSFEADLSGIGGGFAGGFEDAEESLDGVSGSIKNIKKQLMGFDELNIISNPESNSGGGAGGASAGGTGLDLKPLEYDFLKGLDTSKVDEIKDKLKDALGIVGSIGAGILAWKLSNSLINSIDALSVLSKGQTLGLTLSLALAVTGFTLEFIGVEDALKNGLDKLNFGEILGGALLGTGGTAGFGAFLLTAIGKVLSTEGAFALAELGSSLGFATSAAMGAALFGGVAAIVAGIPMAFVGIKDALANGLNWLSGILIPMGTTLAGAGTGLIATAIGAKFGATIGTAITPGIGTAIGAAIGLIIGALIDIGLLIYTKWEEISTWVDTHILKPMRKFFKPLTDACTEIWVYLQDHFFTPVSDAFTEVWEYATEKFNAIKDGVVSAFTVIWNKVVEIIDKIKEIFTALKWAWDEYVWNPIKEGVANWYNENIKPIVDSIKTFFSEAWKWLKQKIFDQIDKEAALMVAKIKLLGKGVVDFVSGLFKGVINAVLTDIENKINTFIYLLNSAIGLINKIPGVNITRVTPISISRLAEGGIVNEGQMFIAREAGPELVGSIGRKTAVANNDQIVSGIESGVYRAMMAANATKQGGSQTIRIINEIDGDVVGEKVIQYHNGRVLQTGASPLLV